MAENCRRCFGRGFIWRYNKKSMTALPCPRCNQTGAEPAKKAKAKVNE